MTNIPANSAYCDRCKNETTRAVHAFATVDGYELVCKDCMTAAELAALEEQE